MFPAQTCQDFAETQPIFLRSICRRNFLKRENNYNLWRRQWDARRYPGDPDRYREGSRRANSDIRQRSNTNSPRSRLLRPSIALSLPSTTGSITTIVVWVGGSTDASVQRMSLPLESSITSRMRSPMGILSAKIILPYSTVRAIVPCRPENSPFQRGFLSGL